MRRLSVGTGTVPSTHTPSGVPMRPPASMSNTRGSRRVRHTGNRIARASTIVYMVSTTIAVTGDIRNGRSAMATRPTPNPASPRTKLATAMTRAAAVHSKITRSDRRSLDRPDPARRWFPAA